MAAAISGWISPVSLYHALARQIIDKLAPREQPQSAVPRNVAD